MRIRYINEESDKRQNYEYSQMINSDDAYRSTGTANAASLAAEKSNNPSDHAYAAFMHNNAAHNYDAASHDSQVLGMTRTAESMHNNARYHYDKAAYHHGKSGTCTYQP
jgi:hypothetical protein